MRPEYFDHRCRVQFHLIEKIRHEGEDILLHGLMEIEQILETKVAHVEGERVPADPLKKLEIPEGLRDVERLGGIWDRNFREGHFVLTVECEESGETNPVRQVTQVLK